MTIKKILTLILCVAACTLTACNASSPKLSNEEIALQLTLKAIEQDNIIRYTVDSSSSPNLFPTYSDVKTVNAERAKLITEFYQEILKGIENAK